MRTVTNRALTVLLALILTGCVSEPAASGLVPDGGASVDRSSIRLFRSSVLPLRADVRDEDWEQQSVGRPVVPIPSPHLIVVAREPHLHAVQSGRIVRGIASRMGSGFGRSYLALPEGPGHRVRICGAGGCLTMTSTDAGPSKAMQREPYNRVADLNDWAWSKVCGIPLSRGLCSVEVTYL